MYNLLSNTCIYCSITYFTLDPAPVKVKTLPLTAGNDRKPVTRVLLPQAVYWYDT